jgi:hypothetical protein
MTIYHAEAAELLDQLLSTSAARWTLWCAEHPEPADPDGYVDAAGELIETLLPASEATLQFLAIEPRVWTHSHGSDEGTVRGGVLAALTSLIADHLDTLALARSRKTEAAGG